MNTIFVEFTCPLPDRGMIVKEIAIGSPVTIYQPSIEVLQYATPMGLKDLLERTMISIYVDRVLVYSEPAIQFPIAPHVEDEFRFPFQNSGRSLAVPVELKKGSLVRVEVVFVPRGGPLVWPPTASPEPGLVFASKCPTGAIRVWLKHWDES